MERMGTGPRERNLSFFIGRCRQLERIDAEDVFTKLGEVLIRYLPLKELKIFDFNSDKGTGRIKIYMGREIDPPRNIFLSGYSDISQVLGSRGVISLGSNRAAILIRYRGEPTVFVEITGAEKREFTSEDLGLFEAMAEYAASELAKNDGVFARYSEERGRRILTLEEYERKKKHSESRYRKFGTGYSEIELEIEGKMWGAVGDEILNLLRSTDYFRYDDEGKLLSILLPCTSQMRGEHLRKRLLGYLEEVRIMR